MKHPHMMTDENVYTVLLRKPGENRSYGPLSVDGRIILNWILKKNVITGGLLQYNNEPSDFVKARNVCRK